MSQPVLTPEEKEHLILLGYTAQAPGIVLDAIKSGNILDPAHMERAKSQKEEWEKGTALLAPVMERQKKIEAQCEQLRQMGQKMEGKPKSTTYAQIEAQIGDLGLPTEDWFLRIKTSEVSDYVDIQLAPYKDYIADTLIGACWSVPRFDAVLHRPDMEPLVIFTHPIAQ